MTTVDAYMYLKPPLELIEHLECFEAKGQLPASVLTYLNLWRRIRSDYTGAVDCVNVSVTVNSGERELMKV